jgi:hypothetical protein
VVVVGNEQSMLRILARQRDFRSLINRFVITAREYKHLCWAVMKSREVKGRQSNRTVMQQGHWIPGDLGFPVPTYAFGFQRPTVLPSTSTNHAKVPLGISTGGTTIFPPSVSTFLSDAATSSVSI